MVFTRIISRSESEVGLRRLQQSEETDPDRSSVRSSRRGGSQRLQVTTPDPNTQSNVLSLTGLGVEAADTPGASRVALVYLFWFHGEVLLSLIPKKKIIMRRRLALIAQMKNWRRASS